MITKEQLDELERVAAAARPGPWQWYGNTKMHDVSLATVHGGRVFVMDFNRWGKAGAQPRFQVDHRMVTLGELGKTEHPLGPRYQVPYRRDFVGIGHPDAQHIAANSPDVTLQLVAVARAALAWRAQITTLSLAAGLPQQVWADLCRLDSEMAAVLRGTP